ncbi:Glutamate--tRNA ligase [Bienertia sinuspersici]
MNVCFVRMPKMVPSYSWIDGVEADDLVARVLKKPNIKGLSMVDVAREVGVTYKDVVGSSRDQKGVVQIGSKYIRVLAPEQVKLVINDAYTCYKIGSMLLSSLN